MTELEGGSLRCLRRNDRFMYGLYSVIFFYIGCCQSAVKVTSQIFVLHVWYPVLADASGVWPSSMLLGDWHSDYVALRSGWQLVLRTYHLLFTWQLLVLIAAHDRRWLSLTKSIATAGLTNNYRPVPYVSRNGGWGVRLLAAYSKVMWPECMKLLPAQLVTSLRMRGMPQA